MPPLALPKYVQSRRNKSGKHRYYFQVPDHMRPEGFPQTTRLNDDIGEMFRQASDLLVRLRSQRSGVPQVVHARGSIPWLMRHYNHSQRYKDLAPKTKKLYDYCARYVEEWSRKAGHPHVRHLTRPLAFRFLEQFDDKPTKKKKVYVFLRVLLSYACDTGEIETNPALAMRVAEPVAQVHIWTEGEIDALVASADALGLHSVATGVLVAAETGQRQGDVLSLQYGRDYRNGRFLCRQSKTKEMVSFPATEKVKARLTGADVGLIVPTKSGGRYMSRNFFRGFKAARTEAKLDHCKFQTLRHTAIVRLARAGCTHSEVAAISGHTEASVASILGRYLPRDSQVADNAIAKVEAKRWTEIASD